MSTLLRRASIGIDIGGTKVLCGIVDENGVIHKKTRFPRAQRKLEEVAEFCCGFVRETCQCIHDDMQIAGVGIAARGYIDHYHNRIVYSSLFDDTPETDIAAMIHGCSSLPVQMDNDVHAGAMAEYMFGLGREESTFTYVNVGTGIACGTIENGHLIRGKNNISGEIGGFPVRDAEGNLRHLEDIASGSGISAEATRLLPQFQSSVLNEVYDNFGTIETYRVFDAANANDGLALTVINQAINAFELAIIQMECLVNSRTYVFGGGVINQPLFMNLLQKKLNASPWRDPNTNKIRLLTSSLGVDDIGLLGGASLVLSAGSLQNSIQL